VTGVELLLASALALPLAMLAACLSKRARDGMPALFALAPLPALAAALFVPAGSTLILPDALLGLTFALDTPGAMLLGTAALLWAAAGAFAAISLRDAANRGPFAAWWLMTLAGNLGVFIAADLVGFYLFFTLVSLAAYGLVVHDNTPSARRAAAVYVALAVVGEALLLMGFVLLAAAVPNGSLAIGDAVAALPTSPWRDAALAFLILGFALKIGLVPLHVWMPLAYTAAPIPAAAVLSGAAGKAGVIGLIRFLPFEVALPEWGGALVAAGLFSAFCGAAIGLAQASPKTVLAYSSVSQMGVLAAVLGMGLAAGDTSVAIAAVFYAMHHVLVKGGLFLAVGVAGRSGVPGMWTLLVPAAVLALGLGGLPLTGGALAKLAVKTPLGDGLVGWLGTLSAIASTVLMLHFLRCLMQASSPDSWSHPPAGLLLPWLVIALASVALPWALSPALPDAHPSDALTAKALWEALWPVATGGLLAVALQDRRSPLPHLPKGILAAATSGARRRADRLGAVMERVDAQLGRWPVAGVLLLGLAIVLVGTLLVGQ
jgi:formate hydrogenlyase subunit 3/multisubunit Na+/H+ antiporter MnhD subunit